MSNAATAPSVTGIWHLPHRGVAVFRESPVHAPAFCSKLKEELQRYEFGTVRFENIDVSNVIWAEGHLSELFSTLRLAGATSQRIKAFRCGAKDSSVLTLCEWLACHDASKLPQEIHLSHNELTTGSLEALITVLEVKSLRHKPSFPYWLRIEGNRMSVSFINELAQEGKACLALGKCSIRSCELMQQGQQLGPSLLHLRFGANQQKVQPTNPQVVFPPVPSSMSGVAPQDGSAAAAAFPAREAASPLLEKIDSAHAMMKELRAACAEPMRALAEHAAQVAQEELLEAAVQANTEAKAAWEVTNPPEGTTDADVQWQNMQASMQQQQQQQQWQQWQAQQMQAQQMQAQQMQAQMLQAQQMQWEAEQQQLQAQQMQAQWNQAQWNQYLQQAHQPAHTQNESGVPQQETLDSKLLRLLKQHTEGEADTVSPKKQEGKDLPSESSNVNRTSNKTKAMMAAAEIEARVQEEKQKDQELKGPKESSSKEGSEDKEKLKEITEKEKEPEAKKKEAKDSKDAKELKLNTEPKSATESKKTSPAKAKSSPERKEDIGAAAPPWRVHRRARKPSSRSRSPRRRRSRTSPSRRRRRNTRSPSRHLTRSPSAPPALKKKPPGANPKKKAMPSNAAERTEPIIIEEDKSAEEAKQKELQEKRELAAQVASLKSNIASLFGGMM